MVNYDNPIMKMLETLANMMMVSFFWLVCSLPIVTLVPSSAALYHTSVKVIHGRSKDQSVIRDFFKVFIDSLNQGWILSLIVLAATFFLYVGIYAGIQIYKINFFGAAYLALGILIGLIIYPAVLYIPVVLSRFEGDIKMVLQLSLYFASGNILVNIEFGLLLALMYFSVSLFPLFLLVVPALYVDLIRPQMENKILTFIKMQGLEEEVEEVEVKDETVLQSMSEFEQGLEEGKRRGK